MKWDSRVLGSFWNFGACNDNSELQRSHHGAVIVDDKFMYIFGGITKNEQNEEAPTNTLIRYNLESGDYVTLKNKTKQGENGVAPPPLSHHTLNLVELPNGKRFLYVFGGRKQDMKASGELYSFDIDHEVWCRIKPSDGKVAQARFSHSATVVDGTKLFVFGGTNDLGKYISDVFIFDIENQIWQRAKLHGAQPVARSGHSAVLFGSCIYIFGGGNDTTLYNDLHSLDIDQMAWTPIVVKTSTMPMKRTLHSATCVGNKMVVFGGVGKTYTNDVMIFDFEKRIWVSEESLEKKPKHASKPHKEPFRPPSLYGHTAVQSGPKLWVFGGKCDDKISSNTLYTLETGIKGVQPIDLGRCSLQPDMMTIVNDSMTGDVVVNCNEIEYSCHKAIFRVRCPPLHKECVKSANDYIHLQDVMQRLSFRAFLDDKEKLLMKKLQIQQECFLAFLQFIYSDAVADIEHLGDSNLAMLKLMAKLFNLNRLYNLVLSADSSNQEVSIPPPTLPTDLRTLYEFTRKANAAKKSMAKAAAQSGNSFFFDGNDNDNDEADEEEEDSISTSEEEDRMSMVSANSSSFLSVQIASNPQMYSYCDVTFTVESEYLCAHKCILSARSAFFQGLLIAQQQQNLEEDGISNGNLEVNVEHVTPHVFKLILEYLYTGTCSIKFDIALELLVAAVNFELERLACMCQSVIERKLHVHNVCKIFNIADSCDAEHLREACMFFMVHHLSQVKKTHAYRLEIPREVKQELRNLRREMKHQDSGSVENLDDAIHYAPYTKDRKKKKNKATGLKKKKNASSRAGSPSMPSMAAKRLERSNSMPFSRSNDSDDELYKFSIGIEEDAYASSPPTADAAAFISRSPTFAVDYYKQLLEAERQKEMNKHIQMRKSKSKEKQPRRQNV